MTSLRNHEGSYTVSEEPKGPLRVEQMPELEKWNSPRVNTYRYLTTIYSFIVMGMNDAAYGALLPYLESFYNKGYTVISLVFLAPFVGYVLAAVLNNKIHMRLGQFGVAFIAPICKICAYIVTFNHPPYPVLPVIFMVAGFGNGLEDGAWNAYIGSMVHSNELLGVLHGAYGLGATISPLVATAMVTKYNLPWYKFYYLMAGLAVIEFFLSILAFRRATGTTYRAANKQGESSPERTRSRTMDALRNHITWICSFFLLGYVGVEVSVAGWMVTYMLAVRNAQPFQSGLVVTGFWLGLTLGRVVLGFVTGRVGEKLAITAYILISMVLELCLWLIKDFIASAVFAGWLGFFLGPLFPAAIVVATKLLPKNLHVTAIGFAAAFGGGGAAIFPFGVGAIAQAKGVYVLQPIVLALLVAILSLWLLLPGGFKKSGLENARLKSEEEVEGVADGRDGWIEDHISRIRKRVGV